MFRKKRWRMFKMHKRKNEYGYSYCANKIFGCVEVNDERCIRCDDLLDFYSCTECEEGYDLYLGGCVKS